MTIDNKVNETFEIPLNLAGTTIELGFRRSSLDGTSVIIPKDAHKIELRKLPEDGIGVYFINQKNEYIGNNNRPHSSFYGAMEYKVFVEKVKDIVSSASKPEQPAPTQ